jgi:3-deoxy-D-manno-octulosonic-acid transferase
MHLPLYYGLYQLLGWLTFVAAFPFLFLYSVFTGRYRKGLGQRLGSIDIPERHANRPLKIWLHGASVGEVLLARTLIKELAESFPDAFFILSTVTEQGMEVARNQLGDNVLCIYAPLDLAGIVGRVINKIKPSIYICLETELWPALLLKTRKSGIKLVLLNGRMTERSFSRYQKARSLMADVLSCFSMISVVQPGDAKRFIGLGAEPEKIRVIGNAKYDQQADSLAQETEDTYRAWLNLKRNQPLFVAGSTHTGEEEMLLSVFQDLKMASGMQEMVWLVAPRHLHRLDEVEALLQDRNIAYERLSQIKSAARKTDVVLVDCMGDLAGLYSIASYIFCGGSLVDRGGHNIMEAAVFGRPVFYGPYMKDFQDAAELLESVGAGFPVSKPAELTESILYFMDHPEEYARAGKLAREIVFDQQGSARKQTQLVRDLLLS